MNNKSIMTEQALTCASIGECMLELSNEQSGSDNPFGAQMLRYGGDTLNTAIYMARQGVNIEYVTALGDDVWSDSMLASWQHEGVGTQWVTQAAGRLPGLYAIHTQLGGERTFSYWREDSPARELFEHPNHQALLRQLMVMDYIYLSGITLSLYSALGLKRLMNFCHEYQVRGGKQALGGKLVFDSNYRPRNWPSAEQARQCFDDIAQYCAIVMPTLDDEQLLTPNLTLEQCRQHYRDLGVNELVIKLGAQGCLVCVDDNSELVTTTEVNAIDTTAAGDSFNGTYLAARMQGQGAIVAAQQAHQVAGAVVQHRGAIIAKTNQPIFY